MRVGAERKRSINLEAMNMKKTLSQKELFLKLVVELVLGRRECRVDRRVSRGS